MADQSLTLFPGDTLTIMVSAGQAPDSSADPSAGADPNAAAAPVDPGPAPAPAAPAAGDTVTVVTPDGWRVTGVVQSPDPTSVGAQPG